MLYRLALPFFLLLGSVLRWVPLMRRDYWYDEAFTAITVRQPWNGMMETIVADVHPPMYYVLLRLWTLVVGSSELAIRAFSVVCGVGVIAAVWWLMRVVVPKRPWAAPLAAGMVAIDPFFVNYSQEARMYALLTLVLVLAAGALWRSWEKGDVRWRVAYGVLLALASLTHYVGAVFAVVFVLIDGVTLWQKGLKLPGVARQVAWAYAVPLVAGLCWLPSFLHQVAENPTLGWVPARPLSDVLVSLHIFLFGAPVGVEGVPPALGYRVPFLTVDVVSVAVLVLFSVLITRAILKKQWLAPERMMAALAVGPFALIFLVQLLGERLYVERYLSGCAVFLVISLALLVDRLPKRWVQGFVAVYVALVVLIAPWHHVREWPQVRELVAPQPEPLVVTDAFNYLSLRLLFGEEKPLYLYNLTDPQLDFSTWDMVNGDDVIRQLPPGPYTVVTTNPAAFSAATTVGTARDLTILTVPAL